MGNRMFEIVYATAGFLFGAFNLLEGFFWLGTGACFVMVARRNRGGAGRRASAAVFLALFGISDFVEMHTGAWWRPWWLLAWKGLCICVLAALYARHLQTGGYWGLLRINLRGWQRGD